MSDMPPITRPMRRKKIAQDAPGTIFSTGVATLVSPLSTSRILEGDCRASIVIGKFRTVEDGVDAAVPVDAQNAPTRDLENCGQFSTASTPILFSLQKKRTTKNAASVPIRLSQQRGSPQWSVPKSVPKRGPMTIIRQPTATKFPTKKGRNLEDSSPFCDSPAALANRRLQPLGHLTAEVQVYVR